MKKEEKFFTLLKQGKVKPDDLDDYVDAWHDGSTNDTLPKFLGMSEKQYMKFLGERFLTLDRYYGIDRNKKVASKQNNE